MSLGSVGVSEVRVLKDLFAHVTSGWLVWQVQHAVMPLRSALVIEAMPTCHADEFAVRFQYPFRLCRMNLKTDFNGVYFTLQVKS